MGFASLASPPVRAEAGDELVCRLDTASTLRVRAAADDVLDIRFGRTGKDATPSLLLPEDVPRGRSTFADAERTVHVTSEGLETAMLRVDVHAAPLRLVISRSGADGWVRLAEDRPGGAWHEAAGGRTRRHYQTIEPGTRHYGLGDKTGPLDRTGRRFRTLQLDALGYDAEASDPLYKHAPFFIAEHAGGAVGCLYDTLAEATFDFGCEHSNYFSRYRHVACEDDVLRVVVIAGARVRDVVRRFYELTGRTFRPPRWALGFAFTSMHHADAEDAPATITGFAREARARGLPISAIHLGSGYAKADSGERLTFHWNERRFADRASFFADLRAMGFRTVANIKPVLHDAHPLFAAAAADGLFVRDGTGEPHVEPFWDGRGAQLDFTHAATVDWWQARVRANILGEGFDACWNDNNEAEVSDEEARTDAGAATDIRPLHALHMARASYREVLRTDPRPHNITRAGPIGICRYAETWTGDNVTSWHTLKWNLRQGLSMALSGYPLVGHDIGGFVGPSPGPELLVRWFQMMALHPRCVMNSWKPETGRPNLPWMHEEAFPHVVEALRLRYRFLPVLEREIRRAHEEGEPVVAPVFYHCDDAEARADMDAFMLGPDVLVLPAVQEGGREGRGWLPSGADWTDYHTGERHAGGAFAAVPAPLERLPLLVRAGTVLRLATEWPDDAPHEATAFEERRF